MYALGTTDREVELSNSAKTGITSPVEAERHVSAHGLFFFLFFSVYFPCSPNTHNVIALTRCVPLAVDLRGDGHLSKVVVPHTSHLLFGSSLRCLQVASKKKQTRSECVSSTANAESHLGKRAQAYE